MNRKLIFLTSALLLTGATSLKSQVTIGSLEEPHPAAALDLKSTTKGLLLPRAELTANPADFVLGGAAGTATGMIVYNTATTQYGPGVYYWDGSQWNPAWNCTNELAAVIITPSGGAFCNAVSFRIECPSSWTNVEKESLSNSNITATLAGAPYSSGTLTFDGTYYYYSIAASGTNQTASITVDGAIGSKTITANSASATVSTSAESSFYIYGTRCFDIVNTNESISCGSLASRLAGKANFALPYTYTLTGTLGGSTSITSVVWSYTNPNGAVTSLVQSGLNQTNVSANTATVTFSTALSGMSLGASGIEVLLTATVTTKSSGCPPNATYIIEFPITIKDCDCGCPVKVGAGASASDWIILKCHNLGADESLDWNTPAKGLNGDYYQWGRTAAAASVDAIIGTWTSAPATDYQGTGVTDGWTKTSPNPAPCPAGWRLPTNTEWQQIIKTTAPVNNNFTWVSGSEFTTGVRITPVDGTVAAYLPAAGTRGTGTGALDFRGNNGYYWSSTQYSGSYAYCMYVNSAGRFTYGPPKSNGSSVRCVAE